jgi:gas vesicle protein
MLPQKMTETAPEKINFLENVISEARKKYKEEWESIKNLLINAIEEFKNKLRMELKEEVWKEAEDKFTKELKKLKVYKFFGFNVKFNWEKRKNLFEKIKNLQQNK